MARALISPESLVGRWHPDKQWFHATVLGPLLSIHHARRLYRLEGSQETGFCWEWTSVRAVAETLPIIWNMTGTWLARRAISAPYEDFEDAVLREVPRLAAMLNDAGVVSMRDVGELPLKTYRRVIKSIQRSVLAISAARKTLVIQPVFGSKILHHYFPSIVPVFDTKLVRNGVLRTDEFKFFMDHADEWLVFRDAERAGGPRALEYHHYYSFCAAEIAETSLQLLSRTRKRFAQGMAGYVPSAMVQDSTSLLWHLDAKIAEYCMVNLAHSQGLIRERQA